ncbi:MAG: tripartite tricarboxylate transporter substrate binding protein [Lachnospiraceae bacterium]
MKKLWLVSMMILLCLGLTGCASGKKQEKTSAYPNKNVAGIVQWGAGGGTDSLMRPLAALAEKKMGVSIVIENRAGATGSIATQYVNDGNADGYTLLMGAENPQLYHALNISKLSYDEFEPILIIGDETVGIVVSKDSEFKNIKDLMDAALKAPGQISMSTTGTGGLPWEVGSFLSAVTGAVFKQVPYDSDATAKAAVLSKECDFTVCKVQTGLEDYKAGTLNYLSMLSTEPVKQLEGVPLITKEYPGFEDYLPWGPFYGVFVKKGTDPKIISTLTNHFQQAFQDPSYQKVLEGYNINAAGLTGLEAKDYLKTWQNNTINALYKSGAIEQSPKELGME